jgi:N-acetylglucosamine-6-phosphate deacetylase
VTDAVSAAGMGPGSYNLSGQSVVVDENLATWAADRSHLVGSAMTMPKVRENLRSCLGFGGQAIDRLTRLNPQSAIGLESA